jgi:hypothetical protein
MKHKTYPLFNIFLLYALFGNDILFAGGRNEGGIGVVSADELYEYDFKLNGRIPREIKKELMYADSVNAYYYKSENSLKIFDTVYFYMKWDRIEKIILYSYIDLEDDFTFEEYKPEYVMKICKDAYGEPETEWLRQPFTTPESPAEYTVRCRWEIDNITITYYYLPYNDFKKLKAVTSDRGMDMFSLNYFVQNGKRRGLGRTGGYPPGAPTDPDEPN